MNGCKIWVKRLNVHKDQMSTKNIILGFFLLKMTSIINLIYDINFEHHLVYLPCTLMTGRKNMNRTISIHKNRMNEKKKCHFTICRYFMY